MQRLGQGVEQQGPPHLALGLPADQATTANCAAQTATLSATMDRYL